MPYENCKGSNVSCMWGNAGAGDGIALLYCTVYYQLNNINKNNILVFHPPRHRTSTHESRQAQALHGSGGLGPDWPVARRPDHPGPEIPAVSYIKSEAFRGSVP